MTRIAIGPETCGLRLAPSGLRELRLRRGRETWYYEAVFGKLDPMAIKHYVLVPRDEEERPEHSHASPYGDYLGEKATPAGIARSRARLYDFHETEDRTDPDLLDMADHPQEGWFDTAVKVVEVPDGVDWYLFEDEDGSESIHETHRTWQ